jgi:NAD(P)-dependent dehydrogenase (short-subunit alcohol dehydrogenase family)
MLQRHLAVNLFGTYAVIQAFLPLLAQSRGAIVNNLSVNALAPLPIIPAYSISKAATFSLTQALRVILAAQGIRVHAVLTGPIDTAMSQGRDIPKASPPAVARGIFDGVENDEDEIFPDASRGLAAELGPYGIRVVCLNAAGMPETPQLAEVYSLHANAYGISDEAFLARQEHLTLRKQLPTVAEIASVAAFIASDRSSAMTGTVENLTAGMVVD